MLAADNGIPAGHQSLLGVLAMVKGGGLDRYWTDTEVFRCRGGNQQLAEKFRDALNKKKQRVFTEAKVASIFRSGGKTPLHVQGKKSPEEAGDVILAVPPSVWHKIHFGEDDLRNKLKPSPSMGTNVKYLMRFRERFWEEFASSPNLTEDGPVDITWETTEGQSQRGFRDGSVLWVG